MVDGHRLRDRWRETALALADRLALLPVQTRLKWAGPDMSARSSITARLMETWAHGQEIYDLLGVVRVNTDRIRAIAAIGVNTYDWTFRNRGEDVPQPAPHLRLTAVRVGQERQTSPGVARPP